MALQLTNEPGISAPAAASDAPQGGDQTPWPRSPQFSFDPAVLQAIFRIFSVVSIAVNDTFTTPTTADTQYHLITNSSLFCRPTTEVHFIFETFFMFSVTTGNPAPTSALVINLQTFLNGYHVLISPTGVANDWSISIPPFAASTTKTFTQTFMGGIFNVEFRQLGVVSNTAPDYHTIDFRYNVPSIPTGWSSINFKPRLSVVYSIPTTAVNFANLSAIPQ